MRRFGHLFCLTHAILLTTAVAPQASEHINALAINSGGWISITEPGEQAYRLSESGGEILSAGASIEMRFGSELTLSVMGMDQPELKIQNRNDQKLKFELADKLAARNFADPPAEVALLHKILAGIRKIIAPPYEKGLVGTRTRSTNAAVCGDGALDTAGCLMPSTNLLVRDGTLRLAWPVCKSKVSDVRVGNPNFAKILFDGAATGKFQIGDLKGGDYRWEIVNNDFSVSARFRVATADQLQQIDAAIAQVLEVGASEELAVFRKAAVLISWGVLYDAQQILEAEARKYPGYSLVSGWLDAVEMELEKGVPKCAD